MSAVSAVARRLPFLFVARLGSNSSVGLGNESEVLDGFFFAICWASGHEVFCGKEPLWAGVVVGRLRF